MKDLLELLKFLNKKIENFIIETDENYKVKGDLVVFITVCQDTYLTLKDLRKIRKFCDDLTIHTNPDGKLFLQLLFLPKKGE